MKPPQDNAPRARTCRVPKTSMSFYDFDEYERLVLAASAFDATAHLIVLLGHEPEFSGAR